MICQGRGTVRGETARWVAAISEKGFNSHIATCQSNITITAQDSPKVTHWQEQPRGRVAGAGHGHGIHVALLAHDTLWSANEPKAAARNCESTRCPQLPSVLSLSHSSAASLSLCLYLLGNCRVNFGLDFRLCQILNIDYLETYSAISKSTRLRLVWHKLHVHMATWQVTLILSFSSSSLVSVSTSDCAINDNYQKCQKHCVC